MQQTKLVHHVGIQISQDDICERALADFLADAPNDVCAKRETLVGSAQLNGKFQRGLTNRRSNPTELWPKRHREEGKKLWRHGCFLQVNETTAIRGQKRF